MEQTSTSAVVIPDGASTRYFKVLPGIQYAIDPRPHAEAHRRYTRQVNLREGWRGYLWRGRFASFPMGEVIC